MQKIYLGILCSFLNTALLAQTSARLIERSDKALSSNFDSVIILADSALQLNKNKDLLIQTKAYKNIGLANYYKGNYPATLDNYQRAIKIAEENNFNKELLSLYNLFGTFYKKQNNLKQASLSFERELKLATELKDSSFMASALNDLGLVYQLQIESNRALENYLQALKIYESIDDSVGMPYSLNYLSEVYANQGKFDQAIEVLDRALRIRQNLKDKIGVAININNIGEVYMLKGDHIKALKYFRESLELAESLKMAELTKHIYKMISDIYLQQRDFEKAYRYYSLHVSIKDSIYTEKNSRIVNELESKYQSEKKQKQIELLSKDQKVKEAEVKNQKLIRNTLIVASCIIILLAFYRARLKQKANEKLANAYHIIEEKNKDITDSIKYAKRIQEAILPSAKTIASLLPNSFILYKPKDIVSGDFYRVEGKDDQILFTAVDCTGHGVPGAFMSIVANNLLESSIKERSRLVPSEILNEVSTGLNKKLQASTDESAVKDGMDIALCVLKNNKTLQFAGAYNPLWLIRGNVLREIKGDKIPIGGFTGKEVKHFTNHEIALEAGDNIYIFTDGFADQFGGEKGKKFKYSRLKELLLEIHTKPMNEQKELLDRAFENWKGSLEQVDDVCLIGVKI